MAEVDLTVSGQIPDGPTTANVTYFVIDKSSNAIVGSINLPNASQVSHAFRLTVKVSDPTGSFDVGHFDDAGKFVSAGFTIEVPTRPSGAVGPRG
jgi:hypothetical protein